MSLVIWSPTHESRLRQALAPETVRLVRGIFIAGSRIEMIAAIVIGPTIRRVKKNFGLPDVQKSICLRLGSAMGSSTIVRP